MGEDASAAVTGRRRGDREEASAAVAGRVGLSEGLSVRAWLSAAGKGISPLP